jgi:molybdate transport system ATP-binding protein
MTLEALIRATRGEFALDLALDVAAGETVALVGPNGAGKTTALQVLAGLVRMDAGRVSVDGTSLDEPAAGVHRPAHRRPVSIVFQDYVLFPHLSAVDNVAFGLRARGVQRVQARAAARDWLDRVGLAGHADTRPARLSGGQAQRVALARALAVGPRLLLLDEPLAALDATTRAGMRSELRRHLADFRGAVVLVTHDPLDAMVLADRLVVIDRGQVVQSGPAADVARHPRTDYVADLVGLNLFRGYADGAVVRLTTGASLTVAEPASGEVFVTFSPAAVALHRDRPTGSPRNAWPATVAALEAHGQTLRVTLDGPVPLQADVTAAAVSDLGLAPGEQVWAAVKATETRAYPL